MDELKGKIVKLFKYAIPAFVGYFAGIIIGVGMLYLVQLIYSLI